MSHRYRYYKAFFRFQNVVVPQGATIDSAYIKLNWEGGEEVDFLIAAVDVDDFDAPADNTYAAHNTETTATVSWNIPSGRISRLRQVLQNKSRYKNYHTGNCR